MKSNTIDFVLSLYSKERGAFRFHPGGEETLLSTCFAVQTLYLISRLSSVDPEKIAAGIMDQQGEDGLFIDTNFKLEHLSGLQSPEYLQWQFTFFSLIALDMLGQLPRHELRFLTKFKGVGSISSWLEQRNWDDFWYCSNEIMFLLFFLTYADKYYDESSGWRSGIDEVFGYLDNHQDAETGFWGNNVRQNPRNGMFGAAHIYLFYEYYEREINYPERIVRSTLDLQRHDGLYGPAGGGACEDYDAVEILARMYRHCPEMGPEIIRSMNKTLDKLKRYEKMTGGYAYRLLLKSPIVAAKREVNRALGRTKYCYSGWSRMECDMYLPDIWGTYFRLMTIALGDHILGKNSSYPYMSYSLPGWGYLWR